MSELYTCTPFSTPIQQDKAKTIIIIPELNTLKDASSLSLILVCVCPLLAWWTPSKPGLTLPVYKIPFDSGRLMCNGCWGHQLLHRTKSLLITTV